MLSNRQFFHKKKLVKILRLYTKDFPTDDQ